MQEITIAPEQSKATEIAPKWHQPTLTIIDAEDAESTVTNSGGDTGSFS